MVKYNIAQGHINSNTLDPELRVINPICLDILYRRGFTTSADIRSLLFPSFTDAIGVFGAKDADKALRTIIDAIRTSSTIVVYRDYDVDGISAGAVAVDALSHLGAEVHHYANERTVDGFGICRNGIDKILKQWPSTKLILTVDNGITAVDAIAYAKSLGLSVVVTDHHLPGDELPACDAVVDLKRSDETYPFKDFCGCGVIFRLMLDLYRELNRDPGYILAMADIVALATVADVVPLIGENRALVREGLRLINLSQRPFFKIMNRTFNVTEATAQDTLAFYFAPVINSLSRMEEDTSLALEAMISTNEPWIELQVTGFKAVNDARKKLCESLVTKAINSIAPNYADSAIVLQDDDYPEGIVGIIAGKLKEKYNLPVIVFSAPRDGIIHGSARSIDALDMSEALDTLAALTITHGGHKKAAGLSIRIEKLDEFALAFKEYCAKKLTGVDLTQVISLSAVLSDSDLTTKLVSDIKLLEPFGEGFPEPLFGLKAKCSDVRYMGSKSEHVKFITTAGNAVIAWGKGDKARGLTELPRSFVGRPKLNIWNGYTSVQFITQ